MNREQLSRTVSYILRHHPEDFDLALAADGSVEVVALISALQGKFSNLDYGDIERLVAEDEKGRFSLLAGGRRIRANYGHSIAGIEPGSEQIEPPDILYHGTAHRFRESILSRGLKPMNRNYVHLSETKKEAENVGKRRDDDPLILQVYARKVCAEGHPFYRTGRGIYLTDFIPHEFIKEDK